MLVHGLQPIHSTHRRLLAAGAWPSAWPVTWTCGDVKAFWNELDYPNSNWRCKGETRHQLGYQGRGLLVNPSSGGFCLFFVTFSVRSPPKSSKYVCPLDLPGFGDPFTLSSHSVRLFLLVGTCRDIDSRCLFFFSLTSKNDRLHVALAGVDTSLRCSRLGGGH